MLNSLVIFIQFMAYVEFMDLWKQENKVIIPAWKCNIVTYRAWVRLQTEKKICFVTESGEKPHRRSKPIYLFVLAIHGLLDIFKVH